MPHFRPRRAGSLSTKVSHPAVWPVLNFGPIMRHATVATAHARRLDADGRTGEAVRLLESVVIAGWNLMQDTLLIGGMVGVKISTGAADALSEIEPERRRARRWSAYAGLTRWRRVQAYEDLLKPMFPGKEACGEAARAKLLSIINAENMLLGTRAEAIFILASQPLCRAERPTAAEREALKRIATSKDRNLAPLAEAMLAMLDVSAEVYEVLVAEDQKLRADY